MTRWYQRRWFYIEAPFPWAPLLALIGAASLVLAALILLTR